ncbi:hypothetical protein JHV675_52010 [Mycobacterium avium subsp. hominissuis]
MRFSAARGLDDVGQMAWFGGVALAHIPHALSHYRKETLRLIAQNTSSGRRNVRK